MGSALTATAGVAGNCSGQFTLTYPTGTGTTTTTINNGTGVLDGTYCPSATGTPSLVVTPSSDGTLTLRRVINGDTTTISFVGASVGGTTYTFSLPAVTQRATYVLASNIDCPNRKLKLFSLNLAPTLSVTAASGGSPLGAATALCPGTSVQITAVGAAEGNTYTLLSNGEVLSRNTTGVFDVNPNVSTTYTVTTITPTCGNEPVSQTIRVATNNLTLTANDADNNVAAGSEVTLTTTGGTAGPYTYTAYNGFTTTTLTGTGPQVVVAPTRTTQYTVSGTTALGNCPSVTSLVISVNSQPLPVEMASFAATWSGQAALLTWTTASEKNNAYFVIERSLDGSAFQAVGQVVGAGTTASLTAYRFSDAGVPRTGARPVYYRLRQVDENGAAQVSGVRAVQVAAGVSAFTVEVFPNPFGQQATLVLDAAEAGNVTLRLQNALGRTLHTTTLLVTSGVQRMVLPEAAALPSGFYYLVVEQGRQKQVTKIVKQ
ncbi:T9SS type A sorting domain-containing protein [Hymenobacter sp. B81]|uniref:T9SS type A sorting domain-containing protein n=1 Tax=Hymenobacter sp. B81 TaxID=3344878 RepID=UPI0037DD9A73